MLLADNEIFVYLMRIAEEDADLRQQILSIAYLAQQRRTHAIEKLVDTMKARQAPEQFIVAISALRDPVIAETVVKQLG